MDFRNRHEVVGKIVETLEGDSWQDTRLDFVIFCLRKAAEPAAEAGIERLLRKNDVQE